MLGILFILIVLLLLALPFLPIRIPFTLFWFNFPENKRPRNLLYIASTLLVVVLTIVLMPHILELADWFAQLKLVKWLLGLIPQYAKYSAVILEAVFANLLFCVAIWVVHLFTGLLFGLFPGIPNLAKLLKDAILKLWQKIKRKKNSDKGSKQAPEPKPEVKGLPKYLYPVPEKQDFHNRITLYGKKTVTEVSSGKHSQTVDQKETFHSESAFSVKRFFQKLAGLFYVKKDDVWYVQPQCKKVAKHLRNFIVLAGLAYLVIFALLLIPVFFPVEKHANDFYKLMATMVENCYLYPAVSLVLLTELFWFMNGQLPDEPIDEPSRSSSRQNSRIVDLDLVEQQLMQTFGEEYEVKTVYSGDIEGQERARLPVDTSDNHVLQMVLSFVESENLVRNDDYLHGIQVMHSGADVLFDAPLYTAVSMYLYPYLNIRISQGECILVICQNPDEIPNLIENMREGFRRVQHTHSCLWTITDRKQLQIDNSADVLIVTPQDFLDDRFFVEAREFLPRVTIAMMPDADRILMANNYLCVIIAERLQQAVRQDEASPRNKRVQYLFLASRHTLNLTASLTEYFMLPENVHNVQAEYAYGDIRLYVWRAKNSNTIILDNSAQTVQLETAISQIASANGVPNVNIVTKNAIFPNQVSPLWLETYDTFDRPIGFTIVSDDGYNLPGTIYAYSRYVGKEASVLHVICKPYMLRDYFCDRAARSLYEQPLMERGMTEHAQLRQTGILLLLCRLLQGLPIEEFAARMEALTGEQIDCALRFSAVEELVRKCLTLAFGSNEAADSKGFHLSYRMDDSFRRICYIQIQEDGLLDHMIRDTELVTVSFSGNRKPVRLPLFRKMLAQKHLPDQYIVLDHQNYKIKSIDFDNGTLFVDQATSVHNVPSEYLQVREYTVRNADIFRQGCQLIAAGKSDKELPETLKGRLRTLEGNHELQKMALVCAKNTLDIDSHTIAYYDSTSCPGQLDLTDSAVFSVKTDLHRKVDSALYLRFFGTFAGNDRLTMTLAVLLQEMMKTMFPDQHFCISVCPVLRDPDSIYAHPDDHCQRIARMYPKLLDWTACDNNAIELLIIDDCEGGTGVLDLLYDPEAVYLSNILDMLCDYLNWLEKNPERSYIHFGAHSCPQIYELPRIHELLNVFSRRYIREQDLFQSLKMSNCCQFCHNELSADNSFLWNNKYNICSNCKDEYVPNQEDAHSILDHIRSFLDRRFGVELDPAVCVQQNPDAEISGLDVEAKHILVNPKLPLTALHGEIIRQAVRLWQLEYLQMTGEPEFDGQLLYVQLQYWQELAQHRRCKRFHSRALLDADNESTGYCRLRHALQALSTDNSFRYMLENFPKGNRPPIIKTDPKRSSRTLDPKKVRRFFQDQLSAEDRGFYDRLFQGLMDMEAQINVASFARKKERAHTLWTSVFHDHPQIHWADPYLYSAITTVEGIVESVHPVYTMDKVESQRRQTEIEEVIPQYLEGITDETGDFDAALQVFLNMAKELDYDSLALDRQKQREAVEGRSKEPDDLRNVYGALVLKRPVCAGYAFAYQYLLQRIGIECLVVCGTCTGGERHAWNIVKMEGHYYHVDVTWGDGSNTDPSKNRTEPSFAYFGLTDADIRLSRSIEAEPAVPECSVNYCNYFVRNGLYFTAYDHMLVKEKLVQFLQDPTKTRVDLRFSNAAVLETARKQLLHYGAMAEVLRATNRSGSFKDCSYNKLNVLSMFFEPSVAEDPS